MSTDITGVRDSFTNLALSNHPGQHVGNLATNFLKLIKIVQQRYAPSVDLGYRILIKVYDTPCVYSNRQVFTRLDKALNWSKNMSCWTQN